MAKKRKTDKEVEEEEFRKAMEAAKKLVDSWPEWKRKWCEQALRGTPYDDDYLNAPG